MNFDVCECDNPVAKPNSRCCEQCLGNLPERSPKHGILWVWQRVLRAWYPTVKSPASSSKGPDKPPQTSQGTSRAMLSTTPLSELPHSAATPWQHP
jgi:hypothetical protein